MNFFPIFIISAVAIAIIMTAMAVGTIMTRGRKCLRGTCGGDEVVGPNGEDLLCDACPKRKSGECEPGSEEEAACDHDHAEEDEAALV